jgi:Flp pilus assembly pilin Flp
MWSGLWRHVNRLQCLLVREEGQDLVEYGLLIMMLVVTATAASKPMAIVLTTTLSSIATAFNSAL